MTPDPDPHEVAAGARAFAVEATIRALVEHASATDPGLRDRVAATAEAYLAPLSRDSEVERDFADRVRAFVRSLTGPPAS